MNCTVCGVHMKLEFLDDIVKITQEKKARVRHECPLCHLRVYGVLKGGKKADV